MALDSEASNNNSMGIRKSKMNSSAIVSLIVRTALKSEDSSDDIPEEVLNDLIERLEVEDR